MKKDRDSAKISLEITEWVLILLTFTAMGRRAGAVPLLSFLDPERKRKMPKLNENYLNVQDSYLFAEIARRVKAYEESHPDKAASIIRLGIGDVTRPLTKSAIEALHEAVDEQAVPDTFKGYGP